MSVYERPRQHCYDLRYTVVKPIANIVTERRETIADMAKKKAVREKPELPPTWIERLEKGLRGQSTRKTGDRAGVSHASIHRMKTNAASWDTVLKAARAAGLLPPVLVDPYSPAGLLETLRTTDPREYERIVAKLLGAALRVEADAAPEMPKPKRRGVNSGDPPPP